MAAEVAEVDIEGTLEATVTGAVADPPPPADVEGPLEGGLEMAADCVVAVVVTVTVTMLGLSGGRMILGHLCTVFQSSFRSSDQVAAGSEVIS